ncbi:hypothetical protein IGI04_003341 [Brassica rapa subsp. trilocularis]|uniref:Uncharacterized protein n=1 Tax=Brassica rapa subsp. trilocularis TaxID=1813537 RepID=A0ABQ7NY39_BRACM|nr:hypothetical protein IGI04_003341 [Brassica rapa subsp. trilocularis]
MSRKLLLDQSSEIVSQQLCDGCGMLFRELSRFVLERCICSHKGLTDSIYPHGNQSYLAQQKGKCSCKYISGGIFKSESHYCIVGYVEYDMEADLDSWQKLLDFGEVKISYISFFDIKKHETVNSRWDLELGQEQMRLVKLLHFQSRDLLLVITSHRLLFPHLCQKFDIGKEKEVKLVKKQASEVFLKDGKFFYKNSGDMLQTSSMKDSDPQKFWCSAHQKCYIFGRRGSFNS